MTVSRSLTLEWSSSHYVYGKHDGVRVRLSVTCTENMDAEIFAYRIMPTDPTTGERSAFFSHVCSPPDLVEWPKNAALPNASPQWVRLAFVDLLVRSVAEAESLIYLLKEDVLRLKTTLDTMGTLQASSTVTYGTGCTTPDPPDEDSESADATLYSWSSNSEYLPAAAGGMTFATQGTWTIVAGGPTTAPETPSSYASISLQPGTSSHVLQISGFDMAALNATAIVSGITINLRLRDATDGEASLGSIGADSNGAIDGPQLAAIRLMAAGYSSDNLATGEEIIGPEWNIMQAGGEEDTWGLPVLTVGNLQTAGLVLIVSVYVPFTGRDSIIEVDGASLILNTRTRL